MLNQAQHLKMFAAYVHQNKASSFFVIPISLRFEGKSFIYNTLQTCELKEVLFLVLSSK